MANPMPQVAQPGKNADAAPCKCIMRSPALSLMGSRTQWEPENQEFIPSTTSLVLFQTCSTLCLESLVPWHHLLATGTQTTDPGDSLPGWGWMAAPRSVSAAFQGYLQYLGVRDFPCGLGSWNKSRLHGRRSPRAEAAGLEEAVPPGEESPEALLELLRDQHSPWALPSEGSPQDRLLREVAVLAPELLHGSRIFQLVKSLRILDKGVEDVDEGLLQFQQLEELILSANHISRVTSAHLPRTLKVLELCCNAVGDLQDLCAQPPPELQHLGLGYNQLCGPSQEKHLTADFWPNLISLDLSFNSLTDLPGLVSQLSTLQNLQVLLLQGNPLALTPTYRGFLVDSLPKLSILDDIYIWPEERQQFHGLARQPELIKSEARVVVSIGELKGLPNPEAFQQLEVGSEGPVTTYSYCVTYEFAEGEQLEDRGSPEGTEIHQSPTVAVLDVDTGETKSHQEPAATEEPKAHSAKVFATPGQPWADTIDWSYRKEYITKDLVGLKSYLEAGTIVSVVEEKVLSWPVDADAEENTVTSKKEGQELKKNTAKQKKKKQQQPCEFRSDPPVRSTLGSMRVTLETLLATEDLVATVCDFGILIPEKPPEPPVLEEKEVKKGKDKTKKPKAEKEGKGKNKDTAEVEEGQELQPVPLTVQFQMQLLRWPLAASTQSQETVAMAGGNTQ
ncbi:leucine-rich repeat-containing protein 43 isoform X2 [Oenanthe melanoleuca]|uniref:leucine-rich repeat-containing protein 43 isoform X2 n=1 Tax=Oenanthe melanoleuca TaxID=2939378 RepID=UPI0024C15AFC|nr:leucine-rich repeat-containing protein 43 isoform X2 [Oenanthe melanoleuca]